MQPAAKPTASQAHEMREAHAEPLARGAHRPTPRAVSPALWATVGAVGMLLVAAHLTTPPWAVGQRQVQDVDAGPPSGALWLWMTQRENDPQQMLVAIDRETRHAAVYHVDATNGTLTLRSTRNLSWDLLVDDFNGREPSPSALKNMLETGDTSR